MERERVTSTTVRSIGYDPEGEILEVEFRSGRIYRYFNVPETVYHALESASSKGRYLNSHIKEQYRYRKIR